MDALHADGRLRRKSGTGRTSRSSSRATGATSGTRTASATSTPSPGCSRSTSATATARRSARRRSSRCASCRSTPTGRTPIRRRSSSRRSSRRSLPATSTGPSSSPAARRPSSRPGSSRGSTTPPAARSRRARRCASPRPGTTRSPRRPSRPAPVQGDRPAHRLPRHDDGRPLDQRDPGAAGGVRAARARGAPRPQHEPLPPSRGRERGGLHAVPARRPRAGDPRDGAGDGLPRPHGAGAERRRLLHAAGRLLAGRPRDLRRVRHPALGRRGDHRLRPPRLLVRLRALRHPPGHRHLRQGPLVVLRPDRRRARARRGDGAVPRRHVDVLPRRHLRRAPGDVRDRAEEHRDHEAGGHRRARSRHRGCVPGEARDAARDPDRRRRPRHGLLLRHRARQESARPRRRSTTPSASRSCAATSRRRCSRPA